MITKEHFDVLSGLHSSMWLSAQKREALFFFFWREGSSLYLPQQDARCVAEKKMTFHFYTSLQYRWRPLTPAVVMH